MKPDVEISKMNTVKEILSPIQEALKDAGITPEVLAKQLAQELKACETKAFCYKGEVVYSDDLIDWGTRQRARMDAHKLLGHYLPDAHILDINTHAPYTEDEMELLSQASQLLAKKRMEELRGEVDSSKEELQSLPPTGVDSTSDTKVPVRLSETDDLEKVLAPQY